MLPPPFVIECQPPTPPPMECNVTSIYGAPKGTPGRGAATIAGIVIHGIPDTYTAYLAKACNGSTKIGVDCHASMHYVIDGDGVSVSSLVPEADLAWAFQSYRTNFPVTFPIEGCPCPEPCPAPPCPVVPPEQITYPGWTVLPAMFPNLSADFYTINIGVTMPSRPQETALDGVDCCLTPYGIGARAYQNLIRLIAWIQSRYPAIFLDEQHIAFHDALVPRLEDCLEFPCGPNGACFICDVSRYCEICSNRMDPTLSIVTNNVLYVYVETTGGCRAKILLSDLAALIAAEPVP